MAAAVLVGGIPLGHRVVRVVRVVRVEMRIATDKLVVLVHIRLA